MPTDEEWGEAFRRLDSGEASYRDEAKRLGVNPSTVQRRYLDYLGSRVKLVQEEHARLGGAVASTKEKLDGLAGKYEKKDQELAIEYARKKRMAEAEFQSMRESLKAKLAKEEREGERRLKKMDAEVEAKNAVLSEFTRRGLEPTKGLELLKRYEDLCGEVSRKEGLLERVSSSIEERKKQQRKEESDAVSRREKASKIWDATLGEKEKRRNELDQQIGGREEKKRRLNEEFKHGLGADFLKALCNLNSEDRLVILRYGLASCTYNEAETLYQNDLNRRLQGEILKIRQGMIKDLMREFQ